MIDQLEHLLPACEPPNVNLQVLPLDAGEHALMAGSATFLEFPAALDLDVVSLEGIAGDYCPGARSQRQRRRRRELGLMP